MKKIICIVLAIVIAASAACALAFEWNWNPAPGSPAEQAGAPAPGAMLGLNLLSSLYTPGENNLLSPASLTLALGLAAEGAQGETLAQLLAALGVENTDALSSVPDGIVSANAVFTRPGLPLKDAYAAALQDKYAAERFEIDGDVVEKVNAWVNENTNGLIDHLMDSTPNADTGMLLINAISMQADWAKPFMESGTGEEDFYAASGSIPVQMMHQTDNFVYAEKDGVQIICLPYYQSDLDMWIALPEEGEMPALLETLAAEGLFYLESDAAGAQVSLSLPKFDLSGGHSLKDALVSLGLNIPFSSEADFSAASDIAMYIDEVQQKVRVKVDEAGTEAAAATLIAMSMMAAPGMQDEPVEMRVDRPFAFVIADGETGSICFSGVVENPAA